MKLQILLCLTHAFCGRATGVIWFLPKGFVAAQHMLLHQFSRFCSKIIITIAGAMMP
jgi:hypothetical protein